MEDECDSQEVYPEEWAEGERDIEKVFQQKVMLFAIDGIQYFIEIVTFLFRGLLILLAWDCVLAWVPSVASGIVHVFCVVVQVFGGSSVYSG